MHAVGSSLSISSHHLRVPTLCSDPERPDTERVQPQSHVGPASQQRSYRLRCTAWTQRTNVMPRHGENGTAKRGSHRGHSGPPGTGQSSGT